jgi:hypothetical protein
MIQAVKQLICKHEALNSHPNPTKMERERERKERKEGRKERKKERKKKF